MKRYEVTGIFLIDANDEKDAESLIKAEMKMENYPEWNIRELSDDEFKEYYSEK